MKLKFPDIPLYYSALKIVKRLREKGFYAVFAGGAVRDLLLGNPIKEIDIATEAPSEEVVKLFRRTYTVGIQFQVVIVIMDGINFEVATFRKEYEYKDFRHPSKVEKATIYEDAKRRDFTINAMYYDPLKEEIIDLVNGQSDLKNKILRCVGIPEERFCEDHLRLIRALRFAGRFNFKIEPNTYEAICKLTPLIKSVAPERIREELEKILTNKNPHIVFDLLQRTGLLREILPEVDKMVGVPQPPEFHPEGDVWRHTLKMLSFLEPTDPPELGFAALFHDIGKPLTFKITDRIRFHGHVEVGVKITQKILERLRFSGKSSKMIINMIANHMKFIEVKNMRKSTLRRFITQEDFPLILRLHYIDCLASHGDLENYEFCKKELEKLKEEPIPLKPLINGYDLIDMGYKPGPIFRKILDSVQTEQLEGNIKTKEEALNFVKEKFKL